MTIGLNETLNKLSGVDTEKFAKKDEFTTQDFSSISKEFSNIFNNQFDSQFENQFGYKQTFSNGSSTNNFMSNTASKMSDEKYSSQYYNLNTDSNNQAKKSEPSQTTTSESPKATVSEQSTSTTSEQKATVSEPSQVKTSETTASENKENKTESKSQEATEKTAEKKENKEVKEQDKTEAKNGQQIEDSIQIMATLMGVQQAVSKEIVALAEADKKSDKKCKTEKSEAVDATDKTETKLLVSIKATELGKLASLTSDGAVSAPKVNVDLKDVKIEKLDVKTKSQVVNQEKVKQEKENLKSEVVAKEKTENASVEKTANKVSLERLTANVLTENSEVITELDKFLNKDIIKKADTTAKHTVASDDNADKKVQLEMKNAFMENQSFNQNFGQANQDAQAQLKANLLASSMTLGATLAKHTIQDNFSMNNLAQPSQANNMVEKNIFDQVMKNIQGNISSQKSEVTMILQPENLGKVTLNIMNEKGTISAEFKAETKQAVDSLNKNIEDLKETLKQQGVICTNLVVKLEEPKYSHNNPQFAQEQKFEESFKNNAQNSDKDFGGNESNNQTAKSEHNKDIQVEQEKPTQTAEDKGLIDYRV